MEKIDRFKKVLNRMIEMAEEEDYYLRYFVEDIDNLLDSMNSEDMFGTEGQCDPRGDFRDGEWSMLTKIQD